MLFLAGMLTMLVSLIVVGTTVAYLVDWDQVIREAEADMEQEWAADTCGDEELPEPAFDYEHG